MSSPTLSFAIHPANFAFIAICAPVTMEVRPNSVKRNYQDYR